MSHSKQRYIFIDLLRFIAVFFMVQGHVFDALLNPVVKTYSFYYIHDFFHGFIAPIFLFASGVSYGVSTIRRWDEHIVFGQKLLHRTGRFLGLLALGYALHLPYFSLRKIISTATPVEINAWLQVDALQCIAITLLLLQICVFVVKREKVFIWITAIAAGIVIFSAPLVWAAHLDGSLPIWLASYFNAENGSWFPLFPWSAYILSGVVFGYVFLNAKEHFQAVSVMKKNIGISAAVILLALMVVYLPFNIYPDHDFWKSDPAIFFIRVGVVNTVASLIFLAKQFTPAPMRIPSIMGRESLFIYILHLLIVYGSVLGPGLNQFIGPTLSIAQTLGVFALVFSSVMFLTVLWNDWNSRHRSVAVRIQLAGAGIFILAFVIRPW